MSIVGAWGEPLAMEPEGWGRLGFIRMIQIFQVSRHRVELVCAMLRARFI